MPLFLGTGEAEAGRSLTLKPAQSTERVLGQPGLHREILSKNQKKKKEEEEEKLAKLALVKGESQNEELVLRKRNTVSYTCEEV